MFPIQAWLLVSSDRAGIKQRTGKSLTSSALAKETIRGEQLTPIQLFGLVREFGQLDLTMRHEEQDTK